MALGPKSQDGVICTPNELILYQSKSQNGFHNNVVCWGRLDVDESVTHVHEVSNMIMEKSLWEVHLPLDLELLNNNCQKNLSPNPCGS